MFESRRKRVLERMAPNSVAIVLGAEEKYRNRDSTYPFRAPSDQVYLTGFTEPETLTVLSTVPGAPALTMFVRKRDANAETWTGRRAGVLGARTKYGADEAYTLEQMDQLKDLLEGAELVYHRLGFDTDFDAKLFAYIAKLRRRAGLPPANPTLIQDVRDLIHPLRLIKAPDEIESMRKVCELTAKAHRSAMQAAQPGMHEYALQAVLEFEFKKAGGLAPSYPCIVGSGDNATILHYNENESVMKDGDLVLIDAGAELNYYAGDITRTFPVNGVFTAAQRDLYEVVLEAEKEAISKCVVGNRFSDVHMCAVRILTQGMVDLGILHGSVDDLLEEGAYKRFYMHKTGHWLGMDVHDSGPYFGDDRDYIKLQPGMIQTVEPGLYIPADAHDVPEAYRGIGIRIEDDILTTEDGFENLTASCPKEVAEIEEIVGTGWSASVS